MFWTIVNDALSVTVESRGAQLKSVRSLKTGVEYLWQGDEKYWKGRAYNLFPIVGRLFDGKYTFGGKTYELGCHGFARDSEFVLFSKSDKSLTLGISADDKTEAVYPFDFIFAVSFALEGSALKIEYRVENVGAGKMYFGLGAHPGFNVPFAGGSFEDYSIVFDEKCRPERLLLGPHYLMSGESVPFDLKDGKILDLRHDLFDDDAVILANTAKSLRIVSKRSSSGIGVSFPDMPYLGIWHKPHSDAPYVCIEPWQNLPSREGVSEDITKKENVGKLDPFCSSSASVTIEIFE